MFVGLMFNFFSSKCQGLEKLWDKISFIPQSVSHEKFSCAYLPYMKKKKCCKSSTQHYPSRSFSFGFDDLNEEMAASAESFLIDSLLCDTKGLSMKLDILNTTVTKVVDISNIPCIFLVSSLKNDIKRAHLKTYILLHTATVPDNNFDEILYRYIKTTMSIFYQ